MSSGPQTCGADTLAPCSCPRVSTLNAAFAAKPRVNSQTLPGDNVPGTRPADPRQSARCPSRRRQKAASRSDVFDLAGAEPGARSLAARFLMRVCLLISPPPPPPPPCDCCLGWAWGLGIGWGLALGRPQITPVSMRKRLIRARLCAHAFVWCSALNDHVTRKLFGRPPSAPRAKGLRSSWGSTRVVRRRGSRAKW